MRMSANRTSHAGDPVHRKRTRSGCLPCRSRRRKCDGALPRCRNCEQRGCSCQWGLKASFHPSRSLRLSSCEIVALAAIEKRRVQKSRQPRGSPTIIDETGQILRGYNVLGSGASLSHSNNDHADLKQRESRLGSCSIPSSPRLYNGHDTGTPDIPYEELYHSKSDDTHRLTGTTLSVADLFAPNLRTFGLSPLSNPIRNRSYRETSPSWRRGHIAPSTRSRSTSKLIPDPEPPLPVSNAEKLRLVSAYMQETGTWCETTDSDMHFTVRSLHDIMGSPAFVGAAMALASRQLDYLEGCERQVTLELYQYTIQLLLRQNTAAPDPSVLAACTLLCVYEMMASEVHEWRRHLKGCAGLLQAQKWNGSSPGIIKSCFWAFARIDIWAAFITQNTTLIPTDFWLDDTSCKSVRTTGSIDDYCNLAILTFAKIVNSLALRSHRENECYNSASATSLLSLWDELQEWYQQRPPDVYPLLRDPCSSGKVFPTIIFSRASSICGNTFYHTGCILLLRTGVVTTGTPRSCSRDKLLQEDLIWHARELAGISMSNLSHANWVNHLHPLCIAGRAFGVSSSQTYSRSRDTTLDSPPGYLSRNSVSSAQGAPQTTSMIGDGRPAFLDHTEQYPTEKLLLLKHLARIERETGWKTSGRAADLRIFWGLG